MACSTAWTTSGSQNSAFDVLNPSAENMARYIFRAGERRIEDPRRMCAGLVAVGAGRETEHASRTPP